MPDFFLDICSQKIDEEISVRFFFSVHFVPFVQPAFSRQKLSAALFQEPIKYTH
jgi:hypothetical protein